MVEPQADADGVAAADTPVASWATYALTGQDAVMQWGAQLKAEQAS
jgi:hypothetical protein